MACWIHCLTSLIATCCIRRIATCCIRRIATCCIRRIATCCIDRLEVESLFTLASIYGSTGQSMCVQLAYTCSKPIQQNNIMNLLIGYTRHEVVPIYRTCARATKKFRTQTWSVSLMTSKQCNNRFVTPPVHIV